MTLTPLLLLENKHGLAKPRTYPAFSRVEVHSADQLVAASRVPHMDINSLAQSPSSPDRSSSAGSLTYVGRIDFA